MAREYASVNADIWGDPDFRLLNPASQHLYLLLWTSPGLTYAGTHDWRPGRLAARSKGFTGEHITIVSQCLQARHFLVVDDATEEVLVRSWVRFDQTMKQPRLAISVIKAYAEVASDMLRAVIVHELQRIQQESPDLSCWRDERVLEVLTHPAVSAKDLPTSEDPFGDGFTPGFGDGFGLGLAQTRPDVWGSVSVPPTPAPSPTPLHQKDNSATNASRRRRGSRIPDDFAVTDEMRQWAETKGFGSLDLDALTEEFFDYWSALPGAKAVKLDWVKTWRNRVREMAGRAGPKREATSAWDRATVVRAGGDR